ncbi:hypothetical protein Chor_014003 [Crotalus horridus]
MAETEAQLLLGVGLIEKDTNGDALWVWCYPSTTTSFRDLLLRKCCLTDENKQLHTFLFGQYKLTWFYITTMEIPETSTLKRSEENGSFLSKDFDIRKAYLAGSVKDIVFQFGMETVILYTALMLKKRIVVYHPRIETILEFTRALPALVWHRQDWSILHSYVHLNDDELEALKMCPGYIAGCIDSEVNNRIDLYDVYVNLAESEITISHQAKEAMTMGKLHKELGQLIVQSAEDPEKSNSQVIKDVSLKTKEILTNLASFTEVTHDGEKPSLNLEALKQKRFPPATENFLYHLAAAEQMLKI